MTASEIKQFVIYMNIKDELEAAEEMGMALALQGKSASPYEIAKACAFEEESDYMRDYISDPAKKTTTINFDAVKNQKR